MDGAETAARASESALTEGDLKWLMALAIQAKRRWQKRVDHHASHGAIQRREFAAEQVDAIEQVIGRLRVDLSCFTPDGEG